MDSKSQTKAWRYVGRFMWSIANVEASVDMIFEAMFNLDHISMWLLQAIDFRKKLEFIKFGFKHQKIDHGKKFARVNDYYSIRNAIAHSQFDHVNSYDVVEDGVRVHYEAGIEFSYINKDRLMEVPATAPIRDRKQKQLMERKKSKSLKEARSRKSRRNRLITKNPQSPITNLMIMTLI